MNRSIGVRHQPASRTSGGSTAAERPIGPVLPILGGDHHRLPTVRGRRRGFRPVGTLVDPGPQDPGLVAAERVGFRRHPLLGILRLDAPDELALVGLAGRDRPPPGIPGAECRGPQVEPQAAFLLLRAVALPAGPLQDRSDVPGEVHAFRVRRRPGNAGQESNTNRSSVGFFTARLYHRPGDEGQASPPGTIRLTDISRMMRANALVPLPEPKTHPSGRIAPCPVRLRVARASAGVIPGVVDRQGRVRRARSSAGARRPSAREALPPLRHGNYNVPPVPRRHPAQTCRARRHHGSPTADGTPPCHTPCGTHPC